MNCQIRLVYVGIAIVFKREHNFFNYVSVQFELVFMASIFIYNVMLYYFYEHQSHEQDPVLQQLGLFFLATRRQNGNLFFFRKLLSGVDNVVQLIHKSQTLLSLQFPTPDFHILTCSDRTNFLFAIPPPWTNNYELSSSQQTHVICQGTHIYVLIVWQIIITPFVLVFIF